MTNAQDALLPCPFCQSTNLHIGTNSVQPDNYHDAWVSCYRCEANGRHAMTLGGWLSSKDEACAEAVAAWNRRAEAQGEPACSADMVTPSTDQPDMSKSGARIDICSAEQVSEREAFEKWVRNIRPAVPLDRHPTNSECYDGVFAEWTWAAWKARAALSCAPAAPKGWQPIETAPRDGTRIMLGRAEDDENVAVSTIGWWQEAIEDGLDYMGSDAGFVDFDFQEFHPGRSFGVPAYRHAAVQPSHWKPLDAAPIDANSDSGREGLSNECLDCGGTGMRDIGGLHTRGEPAMAPCDCGAWEKK